MFLLLKVLWLVLIYLLGSIPFGLVLGRLCGVDVRKFGSGNVGATNVARLCGTGWGILTLLLDAAKGAVPVAVALYVLPRYWPEALPAQSLVTFVNLTALAATLGHLYSVFLKFRGGKAVATTVGVYLVLLPVHLVIAAAMCIAVIKRWGFVSLGSITLVFAMPVLLIFSGMFTRNFNHILLTVCILALVLHSHRGNIVRLIAGEEKPWRKSSPTSPAAPEQSGSGAEATASSAAAPENPDRPKDDTQGA